MEWERLAIEKALEQSGGDRRVAAQLLGIGRTTLFRKLKEYRVAAAT
jgi:two-component system response regulator HydG